MCVDSEFETETIRNWLSGYKCDKSRICTADLQVVNPEKINKETQTSNDIIVQIDLIDIYRIFHPKTMNFPFFSSVHGTFSRIDHILGQKFSLGKFKKNEIISSIFSDHSAVRLDLSYRKKLLKIQTYGG